MEFNEVFELFYRFFIALLCLIVTRYLVPWLDKKFQVENGAEMRQWAETFTASADQIFGVHNGCGLDKHSYVASRLNDLFPDLDHELRDCLIEAAVKRLRMFEDASVEDGEEADE